MHGIDPLVQIAGAIAILTGFVLVQVGRMDPASNRYLALNLVGSTILAIDAAAGAAWGFLLLEAVWAAVSAAALVRSIRAIRAPRQAEPAGPNTDPTASAMARRASGPS